MAKNIKRQYSIPKSIDRGPIDMPISLRKGSVGPKRLITVGFLLGMILVVGLWAYLAFQMVRHEFGIFYAILFTISYWVFAGAMIKRQRSGERGYKWLMPTINYWFSGKQRFIITRGHAGESEVMKLKFTVPVETWEEQSGLIRFTDGSVAYMLDVIGNGSSALFQDDVEHIISTFEAYLKQLKQGTTVTVVSRQAAQDASIQIENLERQRKENQNKAVDFLIAKKLDILKNFVQNEFKSIHQYIVLRARNEDTLENELKWLNQQYNQNLFRDMTLLRGSQLVARLRNFFNLT